MEERKVQTYIIKHKSLDVRMHSRSGGIFTALTDIVLEQGGVIYGCALDTVKKAVHIRAERKEERDRMRGSKYIQSVVGNAFDAVKQDLQNGRMVLFSGTPCQVAGLKQYLANTNVEKLILIDIVCHGVPSQMVWERYITWLEKKHKGSAEKVDFRNKQKFGWRDHQESVWMNGVQYDRGSFTKMFYSHLILRPSCYQCPYKQLKRVGDISIADAWGVQSAYPDFHDNKGVSLVFANTTTGELLLKATSESIDSISVDVEKFMQPPLKENFATPENRTKFWEDYYRWPFSFVVFKYGGSGIRRKINTFKGKIKKIIRR